MESPEIQIEKSHKKILEQGIFIVTLLDVIGSLLSRWLNIDYGWFSIPSVTVYIGMSYLIARKQNLKTTLSSVTKLALYDATIGFILSLLLEANVGGFEKDIYKLGIIGWIFVIILVAIIANVLGLIGYVLALRRKKLKSDSPAIYKELEK